VKDQVQSGQFQEIDRTLLKGMLDRRPRLEQCYTDISNNTDISNSELKMK